MPSYYWIKLWLDLLDDARMGLLPDRLWRRTIELFLIARTGDGDGFLPDLKQVAWKLRMPLEELEQDLRDIERQTAEAHRPGIIHQRDKKWFVTNFAKRQKPMSSTERSKRHRERHHDSDATTMQRQCNDTAQDRPTEAEVEAEAEDVVVVAAALLDFGVDGAAQKAQKHGTKRCRAVLDYAKDNDLGPAWVASRLEKGGKLPKPKPKEEPPPPPARPPPGPRVDIMSRHQIDESTMATWETAQGILRGSLDPSAFKEHFNKAVLLRIDDHTAVLGLERERNRQIVEHSLLQKVQNALVKAVGHEVELECAVIGRT